MRRTKSWLLALSTVAVTSMVASSALAQAKDGEFSIQRFQPAVGPRNFITVQGARTDGNMAWSGGLFVNYSSSPFVLKSCQSLTNCDAPNAVQREDVKVVGSMVTGDLMGSITPVPRVQIGLRLPISYVNGDGINTAQGTSAKDGLSGAGLGDPMLEAKFRALGQVNDPLVLGAALFFSGPVGHATAKDKYIGDSSPVVGARGIVDFKSGPVSVGANLAGLYRGDAKLGSTVLGPEARYGAALGFSVSPTIRLVGEVFGNTKLDFKRGTNGLEADAALQINPLNTGVNVTLGGGAGLIEGVGVPGFRGFAGLVYVREQGDTDKDGIADGADKCPTEPEDKDQYQDEDGCPDPDNDADGVADVKDKCPSPRTASKTKTAAPTRSRTATRTASPIPTTCVPTTAERSCAPRVQATAAPTATRTACRTTRTSVLINPRTPTATRTRTAVPIRTTTATASPTTAMSASTFPAPKTTAVVPIQTRTATASRTPRTSARTSRRPTTATKTPTVVPTRLLAA